MYGNTVCKPPRNIYSNSIHIHVLHSSPECKVAISQLKLVNVAVAGGGVVLVVVVAAAVAAAGIVLVLFAAAAAAVGGGGV